MDRDRTHGASYPEDFAGKDYGYGYSSGYESGRKDASAPLEARVRELEELLRFDNCPELLINNPGMILGAKGKVISQDAKDWAEGVIKNHKEQADPYQRIRELEGILRKCYDVLGRTTKPISIQMGFSGYELEDLFQSVYEILHSPAVEKYIQYETKTTLLEQRVLELEEGLREIDAMMNEGYLQPIKVIGYIKQLLSSSSSDGWIKGVPKITDECVFVTASKYVRNNEPLQFDYSVWQTKLIPGENEAGESCYYLGLLNGDGEEWGPLDDLSADMTYMLPKH